MVLSLRGRCIVTYTSEMSSHIATAFIIYHIIKILYNIDKIYKL